MTSRPNWPSTYPAQTATVAIIGGGASGLIAAVQLIQRARRAIKIVFVEPRASLGNGVAYSTEFDSHTDPLGLGLLTDNDGALIGRDGARSNVVFTLGPTRRGTLLETTAIPEIREQAASLARRLLAQIHSTPLHYQASDLTESFAAGGD